MAALNPFFAFFVTGDGTICPGMTVSDNSGNVNYKCLASLRWDVELCGYVEEHDQSVPHNTTAVPFETYIVKAEVKNERNVHKSRRLTEVLDPVTVVNKHEGCAWDILQEFAPRWVESNYVNGSSTATTLSTTGAGYLLGFAETKEINPSNWKHTDISVPYWDTQSRYYWDEELGVKMTEVRSVVPHATALPTVTTGAFYEQKQADDGRDILTTITIDGYDTGTRFNRTYTKTIQFSYPALLASWDGDETHPPDPATGLIFSNGFEEANARSIFQITVYLRESFTQDVYADFHEELLTAAEVAVLVAAGNNTSAFGSVGDLGTTSTRARIWNPRPRDISYDGLMFTLRVPNVLCDGDTITATASSDDEYYGPSTAESFTYPNSNITATAYVALIGSKVCIKDEIEPWKYGLYKRTRVNVPIK